MKQYAIHQQKGSSSTVIVLQYPGLETSSLVIVAPLIDASELPEIAPITPIINVNDQPRMVLTYRLAAIPETALGKQVAVYQGEEYIFHRALSRLFFGN